MAEETLLINESTIETVFEGAKKDWNKIYNNESLKKADDIVKGSPKEYIDSDADEIEEVMLELENHGYYIQREYNQILAKESDSEDAFGNGMTYYSLMITDAKTEKEKEKRALANNPVLIKLQKIHGLRRKSRIYLEEMVKRIESYVNILKLIHRRRFLSGMKSD